MHRIGLKTQVLIPITAALVLLLGSFILSTHEADEENGRLIAEQVSSSVQALIDLECQTEASKLLAAATPLSRNDELKRVLREKDHDGALLWVGSLFEELREKFAITHFYFIDAEHRVIARAHNPSKSGDVLPYLSIQIAEESGEDAWSLSLGKYGTFTLRATVPFYDEGKLIGFIQLGEEIDHVMRRLKPTLGVDLVVLLDKQYLDRQRWMTGMAMMGHDPFWERYESFVVVDHTLGELPHDLESVVEEHLSRGKFERLLATHDGNHYLLSLVPLKETAGRIVGQMVVLCDQSTHLSKARHALAVVMVSCILIGCGLFGFFYVLLDRMERRVNSELASRLRAQEDLRKSGERFLALVYASEEPMLLMENDQYIDCNDAALRLFGAADKATLLACGPLDLSPEYQQDGQLSKVKRAEIREAFFRKGIHRYEWTYRRLDGGAIPVEGFLARLFLGGRPITMMTLRDITEQKRIAATIEAAHHRLAKSEARSRAILETAGDAILTINDKGLIESVNTATERIFQYASEEMLGQRSDMLLAHEKQENKQLGWERFLRTGTGRILGKTIEGVGRRKDGSLFPLELTVTISRVGRRRFFTAIGRDITERKATERELAEKTIHLDNILRSATDHAIATVDTDLRIVYFNPVAERVFGMSREDVVGKTLYQVHSPEIVKSGRLERALENVRRQGEHRFSFSRDTKGGVLHFEARVSALQDMDEHVVGYAFFCQDVTQRRQAEDALRHREEEYRSIFESLQDVYYRTDEDGIITSLSPSAKRLLGYDPEELIGRPITSIYEVPDAREQFLDILRKDGEVAAYEFRLRHKDGRPVDVIATSHFINRDTRSRGVEGMLHDITNRKRVEQALKISEKRYRRLYETMRDGFVRLGVNDRILECNPVIQEITGYSEEELLQLSYMDIISDAGRQLEPSRLRDQLIERGYSDLFETEMLTKQGKTCAVETRMQAIRNGDGELVGLWAFMRDITDRKRADEALRLQSGALEAAANAILIADREGRIIWVNRAFTLLTWYRPEQVIGLKPSVLKSGKHDDAFYKELWNTINAGRVWRGILTNRRQDGTLFTEEMTITPIRDERQEITHFVAIKQDVSQRMASETALRESEQQFRTLVNNIPGVSYRCEHDDDWTMRYISDAIEMLSGYPASDFIDNRIRTFGSIIHPDDTELVARSVGDALERHEDYILEYRIIRMDGQTRWVHEKGQGVYDENGELRWLDGVILDITDRKEAEESVRKINRFQQTILDTAATAVFTVDTHMVIKSVNEEFCRITGFTADEVVGQGCQMLDGAPCKQHCGLFDTSRMAPIVRRQCSVRAKDGRQLTILKNADLIRDTEGRVTGGIESFVDVTELIEARRRAEAANLAKSEFLANMSHELRTPLHSILSFATFGEKKYLSAERERLLGYYEKINYSGQILLDLLNDLLDLAKLEAGRMIVELRKGDLRLIVGAAVDEFTSILQERDLKVDYKIPKGKTEVMIDDTRMKQVIRNLLSNAVKFSPAAGNIAVDLTCQGSVARVSVRDQGPGIPEDELEAVFDKFVQSSKTKTGAGGTGLGLAICREIVIAHQGRIWARNNPGGGAAFFVEIPLAEARKNSEAMAAGAHCGVSNRAEGQ